MADVARQKKLEAAKKKLKKFQQSKTPEKEVAPVTAPSVSSVQQKDLIFAIPQLTPSKSASPLPAAATPSSGQQPQQNGRPLGSPAPRQGSPALQKPERPRQLTSIFGSPLSNKQQMSKPPSQDPSPNTPNQPTTPMFSNSSAFATPSAGNTPQYRPQFPPQHQSQNDLLMTVDTQQGAQAAHQAAQRKAEEEEEKKSPGYRTLDDSNLADLTEVDLQEKFLSYKRSNEVLVTQVSDQRKQIKQLKEKIKHAQSNVEQKTLQEQLEVHIQTIGILVQEKSELQSTMVGLQKKMMNKENEIRDTNQRLQLYQKKIIDFEKAVTSINGEKDSADKEKKELLQECERYSHKLFQVTREKEDIQMQNSELSEKLHSKIQECTMLLESINQLNARLQQKAAQSSHSTAESAAAAQLLEREKHHMTESLDQHKELLSLLVKEKARLLEKQNDTQEHYETVIGQLKSKMSVSEQNEMELEAKAEQLGQLIKEKEEQLAASASALASAESSRATDSEVAAINGSAMEVWTSEKENLERELDVQIKDNRRLQRQTIIHEQQIQELESEMTLLKADQADHSNLLDQIQADKETISRALQQNKQLKEQLQELQDSFVKVSDTSAKLTVQLETEQHGSKDVGSRLQETQVELEELKLKIRNGQATANNQSTEELDIFRGKCHELQEKLIEKEMSIDSYASQLESMRSEMQLQSESMLATSATDAEATEDTAQEEAATAVLAVQQQQWMSNVEEELQVAKDTIRQLTIDNADLMITLQQREAELAAREEAARAEASRAEAARAEAARAEAARAEAARAEAAKEEINGEEAEVTNEGEGDVTHQEEEEEDEENTMDKELDEDSSFEEAGNDQPEDEEGEKYVQCEDDDCSECQEGEHEGPLQDSTQDYIQPEEEDESEDSEPGSEWSEDVRERSDDEVRMNTYEQRNNRLRYEDGEYTEDQETEMEESFRLVSERNQVLYSEMGDLHAELTHLKTEREKILQLLQFEREKSFNTSQGLEEHVSMQVNQQLTQRKRQMQEHYYQETEALQLRVQSLQQALEIMRKNEEIEDFDVTSDGISMPALKTAFMQLQKRYKQAMDARANLNETVDELEHKNSQLEMETETIGEYIELYQTQRQALKEKFAERENMIVKLSNEHGRMQTKVTQLHSLVLTLMKEKEQLETSQSGATSKRKLEFNFEAATALAPGPVERQQLQQEVDTASTTSSPLPPADSPLVSQDSSNADDTNIDIAAADDTAAAPIVDDKAAVFAAPEVATASVSSMATQQMQHLKHNDTTQQIFQIFEQLEETGEGYQRGWMSAGARRKEFKACKNCEDELIEI